MFRWLVARERVLRLSYHTIIRAKEKGIRTMRVFVTVLCLCWFVLPVYAADEIIDKVAKLNIPQEELMKLGEEIYNTDGANTCLKCHGKGGHGGDQAGAADLRHPRTWRVYQALGGDEAFKANKEQFVKNVHTVIHELIRNGATTWNLQFARAHKDIALDWSKVTIPNKADKYDSMMKGLTSEPMKDALDAMAAKLEKAGHKLTAGQLRDVAAVADFLYVKSLDDGSDQGGVFK
jgi:hypothetical protein